MKIKHIVQFFKSSLKEISPWENIQILHTNLRGDILSGITVAIIALPLALAFGEISQLGPVAGVWGAIAGGIVGGLFGGCMVGVSGPTAPKAAQLAVFYGIIAGGSTGLDPRVAAFSIIFLSGLILVAISLMKISRFIHYTPYPVVAGFMCGIGVIVVLTQFNSFIGISIEDDITIYRYEALYVSIPSLFILFLWEPVQKKIHLLKSIPAPLVALTLGTIVAYFFDLNIPYIGDRMAGVAESEIISIEELDFSQLRALLLPALALAGLAVLDSLLSCKVADNMTGAHHSSDRETFGQGMANMAAGLFGGVTTATATMRTVANIKFGAKTPLASIVHGITLLAILLGLGSLVAKIPTACLAAILFKVGVDILDYRILPVLRKIPVSDLIIFAIVLFVTVYEDLMIAVAVGVVFAFIRSFKELRLKYECRVVSLSDSDLTIDTQDNKEFLNISASVLELKGPLFFGSVGSLTNAYALGSINNILAIDMTDVSMIDLSGAYALDDIIKDARSKDIEVFVANAQDDVKSVLEKVNVMRNIGESCYSDSKNLVVSSILEGNNI